MFRKIRNNRYALFTQLVIMACGIVLAIMIRSSKAADEKYPERPINLIVPQTAGGGHDVLARVIANYAKKYFGVPVVVINIVGTGGVIGAKHVMNSTPDGYNLLINHGALEAGYRTGFSDFNYDSFQPICRLATGNEGLATYVGGPWKDLKSFLEQARKNPGKLKYGATAGSNSHLVMKAIENAANVKFLFVPYQGEAPRTAALVGHHIDIIALAIKSGMQYVETGKLIILGAMKTERSRLYPNLPTVAERGLDVTQTFEIRGVFAPKETPKDRIRFLDSVFRKTLEDPECVDALLKIGQEPSYLDTQTYLEFLKNEDTQIASLANALGLKKK